MLQIREDRFFAETNDLRMQEEPPGIKQDKDLKPKINEITDQDTDVFKGIGKIRDIKNGKESCKVQHETRSSARSSQTETSGLLPARTFEEMARAMCRRGDIRRGARRRGSHMVLTPGRSTKTEVQHCRQGET